MGVELVQFEKSLSGFSSTTPQFFRKRKTKHAIFINFKKYNYVFFKKSGYAQRKIVVEHSQQRLIWGIPSNLRRQEWTLSLGSFAQRSLDSRHL
jgi:hypothetical protein